MKFKSLVLVVAAFPLFSCAQKKEKQSNSSQKQIFMIQKSDDEWKKELSAEEYHILREKGTERAFTGKYYKHNETGIYHCAACNSPLFSSETKYESGSGWPSYWEPVSEKAIVEEIDKSHGMIRTEIMCATCGGHLGHSFNDGPKPTGIRYCINSASLDFKEEK